VKLLDELVAGIAFAMIAMALPAILWSLFWGVYTFWHMVGVM